MTNWLQHVEEWKDCQRCPLSQQRSRICLARGTVPADVLFVGEAPGVTEDTTGLVFTGPAGKLLDQIIARSLSADASYILTNLVACFPREAKTKGDNEPERSEILECRPRLAELVNIAQPRLIVRVGKLATSYCNFDTTVPLTDITHPAAILCMPLVQQQMAVQKCIVVIRNALEDVLQSERTEWKQWGQDHASRKTTREYLRDTYRSADTGPGSDGIAF